MTLFPLSAVLQYAHTLPKCKMPWLGCQDLEPFDRPVTLADTTQLTNKKQIASPQSSSELYRPSDRRLSTKLVPEGDKGCRMVTATNPYSRILGFLERSRYYFFQVDPQSFSRGWVDPVPDPLLLRKSGSAGIEPRPLELWPLNHRGGPTQRIIMKILLKASTSHFLY
jgi:hypothetical protein